MPTVFFKGYVEPRNIGLLLENLEPVTEIDKATGFVSTFTVSVSNCVVSVQCEVDVFRREYVSNLYTRSKELAKTLVNLVSLKMGWGLIVHLDTFIPPVGGAELVMNKITPLSKVMQAYSDHNIDKVFYFVASNIDLSMAINDLIEAISSSRVLATNCSRAIDAIKHLLAPGEKDNAAWKIVHSTLNVDKDYLQLISNASRNARHGLHEFLPVDRADEILMRSWQVMNRYLHYRLNNNVALPLSHFPQLRNAPKPVT